MCVIIIILITMMMMMIIIIIIIIIALKGAIRHFFFLQTPHCAAIFLQHVRSSGQGAIVCKSRVTHRTLITCSISYMPRVTKFDRA